MTTTSPRQPGGFLAIERSRVIRAAPEAIFALVGDPARAPEYAGSGEVRGAVQVDPGPIGVGTRFENRQKVRGMGYTTTTTVEVYEPNRAIIWHVRPPGNVRSAWGFTLTPEAGAGGPATRVSHFYDLDTAPFFLQRLIYRVMFRAMNRPTEIGEHLEATLANIASLTERASPAGG